MHSIKTKKKEHNNINIATNAVNADMYAGKPYASSIESICWLADAVGCFLFHRSCPIDHCSWEVMRYGDLQTCDRTAVKRRATSANDNTLTR